MEPQSSSTSAATSRSGSPEIPKLESPREFILNSSKTPNQYHLSICESTRSSEKKKGSYCDQNYDGKKPKENKAIKNSEIDDRQPLKMRINLRNVIPPNARREDIAKIIPSINSPRNNGKTTSTSPTRPTKLRQSSSVRDKKLVDLNSPTTTRRQSLRIDKSKIEQLLEEQHDNHRSRKSIEESNNRAMTPRTRIKFKLKQSSDVPDCTPKPIIRQSSNQQKQCNSKDSKTRISPASNSKQDSSRSKRRVASAKMSKKSYKESPGALDISSDGQSDNYNSPEDSNSDESSELSGFSDLNIDDDQIISSNKKNARSDRSKCQIKKRKTPKKGESVITITPSRKKEMTPRIPSRAIPLPSVVSPLQEAQMRLHVGAVPDCLPCREQEFYEILSFMEGKIEDGTGGCMYISGLPGTGKTATVKEVIRKLKEQSEVNDIPEFDFIEINGMRLTEPNQAYPQIWKALTGEKVAVEQARNLLEKKFSSEDKSENIAAHRKQNSYNRKTVVLLVDELDMLWNRKQSVLYNIFEWPANRSAKLVVLAIANTMDLPERVMINRVASRMGLTRLTFSPYTHQQLSEIVASRLTGLKVFNKDAVQLVARKVSSLSGDARRALDICRRATEIAQSDAAAAKKIAAATPKSKKPSKKSNRNSTGEEETFMVGMSHVTQAHKEMFCSPKIMAIRSCSEFERMYLQCIVTLFQKTGIEETTFDRTIKLTNELALMEGYSALTLLELHSVLNRLSSMRLVLVEPGKSGRFDMKIRLNVSQDDVLFALKNDDER